MLTKLFLNVHSSIDWFIACHDAVVSNFSALDLDCNLSDHNPIALSVKCKIANCEFGDDIRDMIIKQLRWDKADISLYKTITGNYVQSIFEQLLDIEAAINEGITVIDVQKYVDDTYEQLIQMLVHAATHSVPEYKKNFF